MGFLRYFDYIQRAQDANIQQWIAKNLPTLANAERTAQQQISSRLINKYDLSSEFQPTTIFTEAATYNANSLVELNYPAYSLTAVYAIGNYVSYTDGNVYKCIAITTAGILPTNASYFILIGAQYDLYYIQSPYPKFDVTCIYSVGDRVIWKNKIYQCQIASYMQSQYDMLQQISTFNQPLPNSYPDTPTSGAIQWGNGTTYSVTGMIPNAALPTAYNPATAYVTGNTVSYNGILYKALIGSTGVVPGSDIITWQSQVWVNGDNRDDELVMYFVDIVIFNLMPRIAPMAIPKLRLDNYQIAMDWLKAASKGDVTPNIPSYQNNKGSRIRGGSNVKLNNTI